jgi:hypothetical protein
VGEGDGGLTAFTTPAAGVVKGSVELVGSLLLNLANRVERLAAGRTEAAGELLVYDWEVVVIMGHMVQW